MSHTIAAALAMAALGAAPTQGEPPPQVTISGAWEIRVSQGAITLGRSTVRVRYAATLDVAPASRVTVRGEKLGPLPLYDANAAPWARGVRLPALVTVETTAPDLLEPGMVRLAPAPTGGGPGTADVYVEGRDYAVDARWGTLGRLADGRIPPDAPVYADYQAGMHRIDTVAVDPAGRVRLVTGTPHNAVPRPPDLRPNERVVANIWVPGRAQALTEECLYPVTAGPYAPPRSAAPPPAARLLPKTWERLRTGGTLRVLAWGDSVTAGGQASDEAHRWQNRFAALLRARFPRAHIDLVTVAWGARNSDSFLAEPPGSPYNFEEKVIGAKPDLVAMEFVNDAWMDPAVVEERYGKLLQRFREAGAEWVIITPHYVWPEWMGAKTVKVTEDPRPYVAGVRAFCRARGVALADASLRWGHLAKEGIPYVTLLSNSLNHPDDRGHKMFAQSLMDLFGGAR